MKTLITILMLSCGAASAQTNFTNSFGQNYTITNWLCLGSSIGISNKVLPAMFQPNYGDPITNIVITTNFEGTIQVGTNFYTVKELSGEPVMTPADIWRYTHRSN